MIELEQIQAKDYRKLTKYDLKNLAVGGDYHEIEKDGIIYVLIMPEGERSIALLFRENEQGYWRLVAKQPNINRQQLNNFIEGEMLINTS